jgi:hypothetical protein
MVRWRIERRLRILDFDIENRPLSYAGNDWTTAEITAIGWSWVGSPRVDVRLLGRHDPREMLLEFLDAFNYADVVTGHYIRKHDLPILQGALLELGLPLLGQKMTSDTKLDLTRRKDLSASQESLAMMYGLPHPKQHMSQPEWREANRLTPHGIKLTKRRVASDVKQHKALRMYLLANGALGPPRLWRP